MSNSDWGIPGGTQNDPGAQPDNRRRNLMILAGIAVVVIIVVIVAIVRGVSGSATENGDDGDAAPVASPTATSAPSQPSYEQKPTKAPNRTATPTRRPTATPTPSPTPSTPPNEVSRSDDDDGPVPDPTETEWGPVVRGFASAFGNTKVGAKQWNQNIQGYLGGGMGSQYDQIAASADTFSGLPQRDFDHYAYIDNGHGGEVRAAVYYKGDSTPTMSVVLSIVPGDDDYMKITSVF